MPRETKQSLSEGVYAALITPRREDSASVDLAAALELVDFAGRGGATGVAILGATGEFIHFNPEDRLHLIRFAVKRSRVPVIANVSHSTLEGATSLGREAISLGAAALLLMPPCFFAYGQEEIREFFLRFSAALEDSAPVLLYNLPGFTNSISRDTAAELLSTGRFAGIKDSSGETDGFLRLKALRDGIEDYDLLAMVERSGRAAESEPLVSGIGSSFFKWEKDPAKYQQARSRLAAMAAPAGR